MKILHVYKSYYPETLGGVEQLIHSLSKEFAKQAISSDVITTTSKNKAYIHQGEYNRVYFYPRTLDVFSCPMSLSLMTNFKKLAREYDILHFHFPWPFADLLHLLKSVNKPSVLTYHSDIVKQKTLNRFYQPVMRQFLKQINAIATTSDNLLKTSAILETVKEKSTVIPIGLELPEAPKNQETLLKRWREQLKPPFFLFIGVLRYYKGLEYLIEAAHGTDISIVIAGAGPEEIRLKELAEQYQLRNITFLGEINEVDKWALLELCHAVVAPSHLRTEAFCISLLEGLMHAKPLISTELGTGTSFVNIHDLTGIVIPPKDPAALRQAMLKLLSDERYYEACRKATPQHYQQFFTAEQMAAGYLKLYQRIL